MDFKTNFLNSNKTKNSKAQDPERLRDVIIHLTNVIDNENIFQCMKLSHIYKKIYMEFCDIKFL